MFQNFLIKKMLKAQGVPESQIDTFITMMDKNPELFQRIALEIQERVKGGMDQMTAGLEVMQKHESELKELNK